MNRTPIFLGALLFSGVSVTVAASGGGTTSEDGAYVPSTVEIQYSVCVQCHGAHGEGRPELGAPRIGDLDTTYIQNQLTAFHQGARGARADDEKALPMGAVGRGLPEGIIPELAAFVNALDPAPQPPGVSSARGAALYKKCVTCHGAAAEGKPAQLAPKLVHQDPEYLTRQLQHYRDGVRAQGLAAVMAIQSAGLTDADIDALVTHIGSLRPPLPPLDNPPVTRTEKEGLDAWDDIYRVATHPRCMNCHPDGDAPMQGDDSHVHIYGITRFSPLEGVHCSTCHAPSAVGDG
ncbi:MAG: c-type cytochrome, partial [Myxococcota bacterium]